MGARHGRLTSGNLWPLKLCEKNICLLQLGEVDADILHGIFQYIIQGAHAFFENPFKTFKINLSAHFGKFKTY